MITIKVSKKDFHLFNVNWWIPTRKEWAPVLLEDNKPFWREQVDPTSGRPWKRLSPGYERRKQRKFPGQPILRATGAMQDGAIILVRGNVFYVRTTPYGPYHQFGTKRTPQRPWMGVPDTSLQHIVPIAWKHILSKKKS